MFLKYLTYDRPQHLFQGKADAFCNRSAGRDLYDVWYGLSHCVDRIEPSTRIQLYEHTNQMTQLLIDEWNTDLADDSVLRGQVEAAIRSPIPAQTDHSFRWKPITDSGANRSVIPVGNRSLLGCAPEWCMGSNPRS